MKYLAGRHGIPWTFCENDRKIMVMKYTITIEETCDKDFEIEANSAEEAYELAERKYKAGEFVLDPGECQFRQIAITAPSDEATEWKEF